MSEEKRDELKVGDKVRILYPPSKIHGEVMEIIPEDMYLEKGNGEKEIAHSKGDVVVVYPNGYNQIYRRKFVKKVTE